MRKKQQIRRGVVFALVIIVGFMALQWIADAMTSPDQQVQQLVQKLFAIGGVGAVIAMGASSLTRFDQPKKR